MSRHLILGDAQREAIETAHFDLDDREVARHWTLSELDLLRVDRRRRDSNRFGFAVQLCLDFGILIWSSSAFCFGPPSKRMGTLMQASARDGGTRWIGDRRWSCSKRSAESTSSA